MVLIFNLMTKERDTKDGIYYFHPAQGFSEKP